MRANQIARVASLWLTVLIVAAMTVGAGCSKSAVDTADASIHAGEVDAATLPPDATTPTPEDDKVVLMQPLLTDSPVFLVAADKQGRAIALLAHKDEWGNALAVNGVAWVNGPHFLSIEFDPEGRPVRLLKPDGALYLYGYEETSVYMETFASDGSSQVERVTFEPEELDRLRVTFPSLNGRQKGLVDPTPAQLAGFTLHISLAADILACSTPALKFLTRIIRFADCTGILQYLPIGSPLFEYAVAASTDVIGCVAQAGVTLISSVNLPSLLFNAFKTTLACGQAWLSVENLRASILNEQLNRGRPLASPPVLTQGHTTSLEVLVSSATFDSLLVPRIAINIRSLGQGSQSLTRGPDGWRWQGFVTPPASGAQEIKLFVDDVERPGASVYVRESDPLRATLEVDREIVRAGESVRLVATAEGAVEPIRYFWFEEPRGVVSPGIEHSGTSRTEALTRTVSVRTRFSFGFGDSRTIRQFGGSNSVWVEVCGDAQCSEPENEFNCPEDCERDDTDAGLPDASTSDAAALEAGSESEGEADAGPDADAPESTVSESSPADICAAACRYLIVELGCPGVVEYCQAGCESGYLATTMFGKCADTGVALENCRNSRKALSLRCNTSTASRVDRDVCPRSYAAHQACVAARDAPYPTPMGDVEITGNTPEERCRSACAYRTHILGCGGAWDGCESGCIAARIAYAGRPCSASEIALQDCYYTKEALLLGCIASHKELDATACATESAAVKLCQAN